MKDTEIANKFVECLETVYRARKRKKQNRSLKHFSFVQFFRAKNNILITFVITLRPPHADKNDKNGTST